MTVSTNLPTAMPGSRVGIVDDDPSVCDSLDVLLRVHGFATFAYSSGGDFLADQPRSPIDCLVIDQHMPAMSGLDVVTALLSRNVRVPTVLITGRLDRDISERAANLGLLAVLEKPFPVKQLVSLIHTALAVSA